MADGLSKAGLEADGRDRRRRGVRRHGLEVTQLGLHVAAQLGTVVVLELTKLGDAALEARTLAIELGEREIRAAGKELASFFCGIRRVTSPRSGVSVAMPSSSRIIAASSSGTPSSPIRSRPEPAPTARLREASTYGRPSVPVAT